MVLALAGDSTMTKFLDMVLVLVAFGRRFRCRGDGCPVRQPAAKIAKVESHAKGACSVLHGRDASSLRRQPKIAKGESNGNKLVWLPLPNRILSSMQSKIAKVESHAKGACSVLHGRDASCLRRQPKIAKGESNANFEGGVLKDSESRARRRTGPESLVPARGSPGRVGWRSVEKYEAAWGQRRKARKKVLFLQLPFS